MSIAIELRGIRKRFVVGVGQCRAAADVLRGVDLVVHCGECAVIVGVRGSGKSTLMLCAAGLLTPEAGERKWFGEASRSRVDRRVLYHSAPADLLRAGCADEPHLHLIDLATPPGDVELGVWIERRRAKGDAVIVATRDGVVESSAATRVHSLRCGRLRSWEGGVLRCSRVAEHARDEPPFVDRSFERV